MDIEVIEEEIYGFFAFKFPEFVPGLIQFTKYELVIYKADIVINKNNKVNKGDLWLRFPGAVDNHYSLKKN